MPVKFGEWLFLSNLRINENVAVGSKGVYLLSRNKSDYHYVGRSDDDLNDRLKKHVDETHPKQIMEYKWFTYQVKSTNKEAYEAECKLFHKHTPPDNEIHPAKPDGTTYPCPIRGCKT
jgi:excinuclease UvrABC nuclease subunit